MKQSIKLYIGINPDSSKSHRGMSYSIHQNFDHHISNRREEKKKKSVQRKATLSIIKQYIFFLGGEYF